VNKNDRVYRGVGDAFVRIVREEGFLTLYRGIGPSLVLVSNGALQFMSYEELKKFTIQHLLVSHDEKELNPGHFLCMGALAKVFSATVTYPMAVTRARLYQRKPDAELDKSAAKQPQPQSAAAAAPTATGSTAAKQVDRKYDGMADAIRRIWRQEGWRGFYRGLTPMLIKTAPSSAITFLIYEVPKSKNSFITCSHVGIIADCMRVLCVGAAL
jgi:solute carrier family 25 folate transporter 32